MANAIFAATLAALLACAGGAAAQPYPSRPITMSVPYAAGGPLDTVARIIAERLRANLGQAVVIENAGGAGGSIGVGRVVRAAPDGYTIGAGTWGSHVANGAIYALSYDLLADLAPVSLLSSEPNLIVARKDFASENLRELIAWLKRNPDVATAGTSGSGSPSHLSAIFLMQQTGTSFALVPYRGAGLALQDLLAGHLDLMLTGPSILLPQWRGGAIKAYAVAAHERLTAAPEIPTTEEAGLPGFTFTAWTGLWVPKATPRAIIARLSEAVRDALADPALRARLNPLGIEIPPAGEQGPEPLRAFQKAEIEKWWPIIKAAGIKPE
jgi:tripartite-type tricarboxylate transporter receptor subunit TctC